LAGGDGVVDPKWVQEAVALELVSHLRDRLEDQPDGKPQRLRESTVQKLRDFLATFDLRNVVDDQELKEQVDSARALLAGKTTDAIRNTAELQIPGSPRDGADRRPVGDDGIGPRGAQVPVCGLICRRPLVSDLDCALATQTDVAGARYLAHPALTKAGADLVPGEFC
jgi:hypothetical protein